MIIFDGEGNDSMCSDAVIGRVSVGFVGFFGNGHNLCGWFVGAVEGRTIFKIKHVIQSYEYTKYSGKKKKRTKKRQEQANSAKLL